MILSCFNRAEFASKSVTPPHTLFQEKENKTDFSLFKKRERERVLQTLPVLQAGMV